MLQLAVISTEHCGTHLALWGDCILLKTRPTSARRPCAAVHTYLKHPIRPRAPMHARARGCYKKRGLVVGLGVMLVRKGGAADEGGGASATKIRHLAQIATTD